MDLSCTKGSSAGRRLVPRYRRDFVPVLRALHRLPLGARRLVAAAGLASVATVGATLAGASAAAAPTAVTPPPSHSAVHQVQAAAGAPGSVGSSPTSAPTSTPR